MKRRDLIKKLEDAGFLFKDHGGIMIRINVEMIRNKFLDTLKLMRLRRKES